jgi:hypothetical protein
MFLDEIQMLYIRQLISNQPNPNCKPFVRIIREIQKLSKTRVHTFGVISGSASNTQDHTYIQDQLMKEGSYPNLNNRGNHKYIRATDMHQRRSGKGHSFNQGRRG